MLAPPECIWWRPVGRLERAWILIAFTWGLFLTLMMPLWFFVGRQNVPTNSYRMAPEAYQARVEAFVKEYRVGTEKGIPVVAPPPGSDIYLLARRWEWYPVLRLRKGQTYRLHLSSTDIQHGFSVQPLNLNLQVLPGYVHILEIQPTRSGLYTVVCNEFCGIGHHLMVGRIEVVE